MERLVCVLLIFSLVHGAIAYEGELGNLCRKGDRKCNDDNAYCNVGIFYGDCVCNTNFYPLDNRCSRRAGQVCGSAMCVNTAVCSTDGICVCDTSAGFAQGTYDDTSCSCLGNTVAQYRRCVKKVGASCTTRSDCILTPGMICGNRTGASDTRCTCNTKENFLEGSTDDLSCNCKTNYTLKAGGTCGLMAGKTACDTRLDCLDNAVCDANDACVCDTANNYVPVNNLCVCNTGYTMKKDGSCGGNAGQTCSSHSECMDTARCDIGNTNLCECDPSQYRVFSSGQCVCVPNYVERFDGLCGRIIGMACNTSLDECMDRAVCDAVTSRCVCDVANHAVPTAAGSTCPCDCNTVATPTGCKQKIGHACSSSVCTAYASCRNGVCTCDPLSVLLTDNTCKGGAGYAVSSLLHVLAGMSLALRVF